MNAKLLAILANFLSLFVQKIEICKGNGEFMFIKFRMAAAKMHCISVETFNWKNHQVFSTPHFGSVLYLKLHRSKVPLVVGVRVFLPSRSHHNFQFSYPKQNQILVVVVIVIKCNVLVVNQLYRLFLCTPHVSSAWAACGNRGTEIELSDAT